MNIAIVRPSNSYGPRDSDDLETAHALGSLIMKAINKMDPFVIWGDGNPIREYIYAKDAAKGMLLAMEKYCVGDPINLASGESVSITELAKDCEFFNADALIATGNRTGDSATSDEVSEIKKATSLPVLIGSGVNKENLDLYYSLCDGFIVASSLKFDGLWQNPVEYERVKSFVRSLNLLS